jgi:hypothetical protein
MLIVSMTHFKSWHVYKVEMLPSRKVSPGTCVLVFSGVILVSSLFSRAQHLSIHPLGRHSVPSESKCEVVVGNFTSSHNNPFLVL